MSMENHGGMILTGENFCLVHQSSLAILPKESSSSKTGRTGEGNDKFVLVSLFILDVFLTCHKILQHGTDRFTFSLKEGMLQIFIALKNPLPSAGFEPMSLGSIGKHTSHYTTEDDL
jgi:hypothetical protein